MLRQRDVIWMNLILLTVLLSSLLSSAAHSEEALQVAPKMTDQFERPCDLSQHAGSVVVLVYSDRKGTRPSRELGEWLHVTYHPTATHLPPDKGQFAPVRPYSASELGPEVRVIPVACTGKVPQPLQALLRQQFRKGSPDVPVWLDFDDTLKSRYGLREGEPNLLVFDGRGELRFQTAGSQSPEGLQQIISEIDALRREIVLASRNER